MKPLIHMFDFHFPVSHLSVHCQQTPSLLPGEIHLWKADSSLFSDCDCLKELLSEEEKLRLASFGMMADKIHFALGHAMVRLLLGQYASLPQSQIDILRTESGKPYLQAKYQNYSSEISLVQNNTHSEISDVPAETVKSSGTFPTKTPKIFFNISHARDVVLAGFSSSFDLGVDVEFTGRSIRLESLARKVLHPVEAKLLEDIGNPAQKKERFFCFWTAKEAFLKGTGEGIRRRLSTFYTEEIPLPEGSLLPVIDEDAAPGARLWQVQGIPMPQGYCGCAACSPVLCLEDYSQSK